jgi:hypothetical protein
MLAVAREPKDFGDSVRELVVGEAGRVLSLWLAIDALAPRLDSALPAR